MNPLSVKGSLHFADETAWKGSAPGVGGTKSSPETASLAARLGNFEKRP
jgi:hypothetical protein